MKISLQWLNDHIDLSDYTDRPDELAKLLTGVGLEVEAVENRAATFRHVVVGHIQQLDRHPNADRLTVCQVDVGDGQLKQIVCGAKNHRAGDKVVVTLPGAVLPGNFEIKKSKIRDVESHGMLASESELGLKAESEGILILDAAAPVGVAFAEFFGMNDVVFEINVSPNRADCLSHLGLARELATLLDRPLKTPAARVSGAKGFSTKATVAVDVRQAKLCPRYSGRSLRGVKVGPSPDWLRRRLESVGLNSINNVVDVTNFVMMDLGQPLHAFDRERLAGSTIIVDVAQVGEKFQTLDKSELTLTGDELTIRDGDGAVCLAGVMGGLRSGVSDSTKEIFLESALFAMDSVRKTARRHGLQTDSAYRFSRGTDLSGVVNALDRAAELILQVAGGEVSEDLWDLNAGVGSARSGINITAADVAQRLGYNVEITDLSKWMQRLGCKVESSGQDGLTVTPPSYRGDLEQSVDLVEEYGRLNGYEQIPETMPTLSYAPLKFDKEFSFETRVCELARAAGLSQCVNYGFVGRDYQSQLLGALEAYRAVGLEMDSDPIALRNPLSEDLNVMRVSLLPGLIKNLCHNYRHGNTTGRLFEVGYTFRRGPEGYVQDPRLSLVAWGPVAGLWQKSEEAHLEFYDLKARLQMLTDKLLISQVQWRDWAPTGPLLHPAQTASLFVEGRSIGFFGTLHPQFLLKEKIRVGVAVAELDLKALGRGQPRLVKYKSISKFPSVERDLAFVMPKSMRAQEVMTEIKMSGGELLQGVEVFDVFEGGAQLPPEHVSVAFRMIFQDLKETLTEERMTAVLSGIVDQVGRKLALKVR